MKRCSHILLFLLLAIGFFSFAYSQTTSGFKLGDINCTSVDKPAWETYIDDEGRQKKRYNPPSFACVNMNRRDFTAAIYKELQIILQDVKYPVASFRLVIQAKSPANNIDKLSQGAYILQDESIDKLLQGNEELIVYFEDIKLQNGKLVPGIAMIVR